MSDLKTTTPPKEKKSRDGLYILIILLLLGGIGYFAWETSQNNTQINECNLKNDLLSTELGDLNELMYDQSLTDGETLKSSLESMLAEYESRGNDNSKFKDSIEVQKQKIADILVSLEKEKGNKRYYAKKVRELTEETDALRSIMKDYIRTIDSLNTENGILKTNLNNTQVDLTNMTSERDDKNNQINNLTEIVSSGSKLVASAIVAEGIKQKGSGSYKITERASRCTHIRSRFIVGRNTIANKGKKTIYMRILDGSGKVLKENSGPIPIDGGKTISYSDKKTIDYTQNSIDVAIFYELKNTISKGNYTAELWCEGVRIGKTKFVLK